MKRFICLLSIGFIGILLVEGLSVNAQPIENEVILNSSMGKLVTDTALDAFKKYAKDKWGIDVKVGALHAGGQMIYSKVVEWAVNPQADMMWGSDAWMFDELEKKAFL